MSLPDRTSEVLNSTAEKERRCCAEKGSPRRNHGTDHVVESFSKTYATFDVGSHLLRRGVIDGALSSEVLCGIFHDLQSSPEDCTVV